MSCPMMDERLDDWVDGTLPEEQRLEVQAHLATCPDCREEERQLRHLLSHAAALPRSVTPPRDLWPGISRRLDQSTVAGTWPSVLAVAAAVVLALGAVIFWQQGPAPVHTVVVPDRATSSFGPVPASVKIDPGLVAMEQDYQVAANALMEVLQERKDALDPEALAIVERNLAVIDEALAEIHRALEKDPDRPELSRMLVSTHRKRVDVLRKMVKLSSSL